jgi:hypothetical protein
LRAEMQIHHYGCIETNDSSSGKNVFRLITSSSNAQPKMLIGLKRFGQPHKLAPISSQPENSRILIKKRRCELASDIIFFVEPMHTNLIDHFLDRCHKKSTTCCFLLNVFSSY